MRCLSGLVYVVLCSVLVPLMWASCAAEKKPEPVIPPVANVPAERIIPDYDTTKWTELTVDDGYVIDIRYATADNFVKEVIYPCGRMFLRPEAAAALAKVNDSLRTLGYKLKLFDGYRPRPAQQKLWDKVPNPSYVAPPSEGSMHSRGVAIDLTLANLEGKEVDMGTPYDFFGREAHHDYTSFPPAILERRQLLREIMGLNGFQSIRTEWWHYSYSGHRYPLDDWQWACEH